MNAEIDNLFAPVQIKWRCNTSPGQSRSTPCQRPGCTNTMKACFNCAWEYQVHKKSFVLCCCNTQRTNANLCW
jgi:hypothetical protein